MKITLLLLLASLSVSSAQTVIDWQPKEKNPINFPVDEKGEIQFREIVSTPKLNTPTVIKKARKWVASTYPSANDMVQEFDTAAGVMIVKGVVKMKQGASLGHMLVVEAKDGRYRATINQLVYQYEVTAPVRVAKEVPFHAYGVDADDYYTMYTFIIGTTGANSALMNLKRMSIKAADKQTPYLAEVKQKMESMLESLKKSIETQNDW